MVASVRDMFTRGGEKRSPWVKLILFAGEASGCEESRSTPLFLVEWVALPFTERG